MTVATRNDTCGTGFEMLEHLAENLNAAFVAGEFESPDISFFVSDDERVSCTDPVTASDFDIVRDIWNNSGRWWSEMALVLDPDTGAFSVSFSAAEADAYY